MSRQHETQVLVVGAGPVGLFTALLLAKRGVQVRIVDEEFRIAAHSYALALHPHSLHLLDETGVVADLLEQGRRIETVAFYDGADRVGEMKLSELGGSFPYVLVAPQSVLEGVLEKHLRQEGVTVEWNHHVRTLQPDKAPPVATIEKMVKAPCGYAVATTEWVIESIAHTEAAFVVGADGHRSIVRKALEFQYESVGVSDSFAVFEFHTGADLAGEVRIVLGEQATSVLWPLPGGRCRWSFQMDRSRADAQSREKHRLTVPIGKQAFPYLAADVLDGFVRERAPWFQGEIRDIDWSMVVRFDRRLAERFGRGRCWLAGDAAHLTGPVGGQSLNMGLQEAHDLAGRLIGILCDGSALDSLEDYNDTFLKQWRQLLDIEGGLTASDRAQPWTRRHCRRILPCIPATGIDLANLAVQIGLDFGPAAHGADEC